MKKIINNIYRQYYLFLLPILLTACTSNVVHDENSFLYSITPDSTLTLHQKITIPESLGRVYFQDGHITKNADINIYYPHCSLTINELSKYPQIIEPTTFTIIKVVDDEEYANNKILYADINIVADGPTITGLVSYYYLQSESEPNVRTLECIQWDSLYENRLLSIKEIRMALGSILTLNLNEKEN